MKTHLVTLVAAIIFCVVTPSLKAQETSELMKKLLSEDSAAVTAVALYPTDVRDDILEVCTYPELLVRTEVLQKNASNEFRKLLSKYSRDEQENLWNLSRYPGLIAKISGGKKTRPELEVIAADYPEEIQSTIIDYGRPYYDVISSMNLLDINTQNTFEAAIKNYSEKTKVSIRNLFKLS